MAVYDKPGNASDSGLEHEPSSDKEALDSSELAKQESSFPGRNAPEPSSSDRNGLAASESQPDDSLGAGYNPDDSGRRRGRWFVRNRRKLLAGGGVAAGLAGISASVFLLLIPLKIEHIVSNLQQRFFATSEGAVQKETDTLLQRYITQHVLPSYKSCGTTISSACRVKVVGTNPVSNLYKTWSDARLENKLATDYGVEFKYESASKSWYLKAPGSSLGGDKIGANGENLANDFNRADRATMRNAIHEATQNETKWKQVMYRFKVGRLLEEKYGIKRCIMFCGTKDALADFKDNKTTAAKIWITQRVITPRTETLGIVMECLLDPGCNPEETKPISADAGSAELSGAPENPETDTEVRTTLTQLAETYGITDDTTIKKMIQDYEDLSSGGYSKYALDKVLEKFGLSELSDNVSDATPVIGWINFGAKLITGVNKAGPTIKKLGYITNATAAVSLYMMYRSYADEVHTGHVDATEVGSMVNSLGPSSSDTTNDVGGTAGAEDTPLYGALMDNGGTTASTSTSLIDDFLPTKAYAASTTASSNYKCDGNTNVPAGKLVCPEEVLGQGNCTAGTKEASCILNKLHDFLNLPGISYITRAAGLISSITSALSKLFGGVIGALLHLLGLSSLVQFIDGLMQPVFNFAINQLIPNPFGANMSGGRTFDMAAAGADVAGNDYAHTGLGGAKLSQQQVNTILAEQQSEEQLQFNHSSFFARMFSTDSQYSLVSKVAMDIPFNFQSASAANFASMISNPFGTMTHGFSSMFSSHAMAATQLQEDPFNVTQYGYTSVPSDPEQYWNDHCSDNPGQAYQNDHDFQTNSWNQAAADGAPDDNTGMPVNTTTNPCMLIKATVGSAGGAFDTSLLAQDDLGDTGSISASTNSVGAGLVWPFATKSESQYNRIDQGWDIQDKAGAPIYAIAPGTLNVYASDPGGFGNDYPVEQLDSSIGGPSSWVYYGHVHIIPTLRGQHVNAGQLIAYANTTDPQNGSDAPPGWLEIGFAQPNTDAPIQRAAESVATQAGQQMHDLLINAEPSTGSSQ